MLMLDATTADDAAAKGKTLSETIQGDRRLKVEESALVVAAAGVGARSAETEAEKSSLEREDAVRVLVS